jgi:hypothetical protein
MTIVGVYDHRRQAEAAVRELREAGFRDDQIGIIVPDDDPAKVTDTVSYNAEEGAINGAVTGTIAGGVLGALAALTVPGLGAVLASALVAGILTGATAGAAAGGLLSTLIGLGIPETDAPFYESELRAGRILVTVSTNDHGDDARSILSRHGGYDVVTARDATAPV